MREASRIFSAIFVAFFALLTAMPAFASDYTLGIFGNANLDDRIDEKDIDYLKGVISGTNPATKLSDANYDGKIDAHDIDQIKYIISGDERNLTLETFTIYEEAKVVTVPKPVERIVVLPICDGEAIMCVNSADKVVGVGSGFSEDKNRAIFPLLSQLPTVGKWSEPDIEAIVSLDPDLVIADLRWPDPEELEDKLQGFGIPVVRMGFTYPDFSLQEMMMLGYLLDERDSAEKFVAFEKGYLDLIEDRLAALSDDEKPRVFPMYSIWKPGSEGSIVHMLCLKAGGKNIAADLRGGTGGMYPEVDSEWLIMADPEVMFQWSAPGGYNVDDNSEMEAEWLQIISRPELANVTAIKEQRVYMFAPEITSRPCWFVSLAYLAKWLHPDLFTDLEPQAIHQEYLTRFLRLDYDLSENGVFVYPTEEAS
ncbi:MAG: ABC transporter substrate-binding protein [Methanothrix sp.]|jgi:iron complex transport system substrate-binding protein|nr:ABC transporter substrate-binding protein [Methanothrix sp.]HQI68356.1 ABC transporter substrate-binding protein [Methanothrix sp.]HRS84810.1 ABC transporter substrate-binding protein [Methanothrix sp.]HRT17592.1 ABC transporter substrate-binding protein [Methanothrix sp.]